MKTFMCLGVVGLLSLSCTSWVASQAFAQDRVTDLKLHAGIKYEARFQKGKGRAEVIATGDPGIILVTRDSNTCFDYDGDGKIDASHASGHKGDFDFTPFRLKKVSVTGNTATYVGEMLPLTDQAKNYYHEEYQGDLAETSITIEATNNGWTDDDSGVITTTTHYFIPHRFKLSVTYRGETESFEVYSPFKLQIKK